MGSDHSKSQSRSTGALEIGRAVLLVSLERTQLKKEAKIDPVQTFQSHQLWRKVPMDAEKAVIYERATGRAQNEATQASYTAGEYL